MPTEYEYDRECEEIDEYYNKEELSKQGEKHDN